ncbi:hypothetical protein HK104_000398 [Borealophlyctis nickersoniae]|nr:hypothetical protein HK104_000398 [Borealophlyctis nickersoniae]
MSKRRRNGDPSHVNETGPESRMTLRPRSNGLVLTKVSISANGLSGGSREGTAFLPESRDNGGDARVPNARASTKAAAKLRDREVPRPFSTPTQSRPEQGGEGNSEIEERWSRERAFTECVEDLKSLGLESVLDILKNEIALITPRLLTTDVESIVVGAIDAKPTGASGLHVNGTLARCYQALRRFEAFSTILKVEEVLSLWHDQGGAGAELNDVWKTMRENDARLFVADDLNRTVMGHVGTLDGRMRWAGAGVKGWFDEDDAGRRPLHSEMEDTFYMPRSSHCFLHTPTNIPIHIFCLADGHGGRNAAKWFVQQIPSHIITIFNGRPSWDLEKQADESALTDAIMHVFSSLDAEFCDMRRREYLAFSAREPTDRTMPGMSTRASLPPDDGCTLNVVIIFGGRYLISAHVGDTRTVVGQTSPLSNHTSLPSNAWAGSPCPYTLAFATTDHSPAHPTKALRIHRAGGIFRESKTSPEIPISHPSPSSQPHSSAKSDALSEATLLSLTNARVFRPPGFINPYGVATKHMSLSDAMGDVVMKVEPRLFDAKPDVTILPLDETRSYVVVLASDGVWSCMEGCGGAEGECSKIVQAFRRGTVGVVGGAWGGVGDGELMGFADALCARAEGPLSDLFGERGMWDDVSVVVVTMNPADYMNGGYFKSRDAATSKPPSLPFCIMTGDAADVLGYSFHNAVCLEELCRRDVPIPPPVPDGLTFPQLVKTWVGDQSPEVFFKVAVASSHTLRILSQFVKMLFPKDAQCGQFNAPMFTGEWYYPESDGVHINFDAVIRKATNLLDEGDGLLFVQQISNYCDWDDIPGVGYAALDALGRFLKGEVNWKIHLPTSPTGVVIDKIGFPSIFSYERMDGVNSDDVPHNHTAFAIFRQCTLKMDVGGGPEFPISSSSRKCLKKGSKVQKIILYITEDYQGFLDFLGGPLIKAETVEGKSPGIGWFRDVEIQPELQTVLAKANNVLRSFLSRRELRRLICLSLRSWLRPTHF